MILDIPVVSSGVEAMSFDATLLSAAESGAGGWRVYRWDSVWVTLGFRQKPESALVDCSSTPYALRPTGGLAVLHGHDLTFSLALQLREIGLEARNVRAIFEMMTEPLLEALHHSGVRVRRGSSVGSGSVGAGLSGEASGSSDCFASHGAYDFVDEVDRKVCGCALRIRREGALLQASIPLHAPMVDPASVIVGATRFEPRSLDGLELAARLSESMCTRMGSVPWRG